MSGNFTLTASSAYATWWGTCPVCGQTLSICQCNKLTPWQPTWTPVPPTTPFNPLITPSFPLGTPNLCNNCGQALPFCNCLNTITTTGTSVSYFTPNPVELISDFLLRDILTSEQVHDYDKVLSIIRRESGFMGTMSYLTLPSMFSNYFLYLGKDEKSFDIWTLLSPLLFKFTMTEKEKVTEHFVTVLAIRDMQKDDIFVRLKDVRLVEIVDNFAFFQLAERDKAFRKRLKGEDK